ncbi:TPA: hypothetical protein H2W70_004108 [Salmonella enterica]|nr:hypothetical protein [Salmonella enterica]HAK8195212.1 hypothetical protein [Salmonella enterica]HAK8434560.1 hypothetical protein [Salmonella enterica]HAK8462308.1 hypothetical protein [Salmonella enterica]
MNNLITIENSGQAITKTNYWQTEYAEKGFVFLSWNAGAARLLVPDSIKSILREMKTAHYVIISRGQYEGRDAFELLFEDNSDNPFCLHIMAEQTDRMLPESDQGSGFVVTIWTRGGQKHRFEGKYREVAILPCLESWSEH